MSMVSRVHEPARVCVRRICSDGERCPFRLCQATTRSAQRRFRAIACDYCFGAPCWRRERRAFRADFRAHTCGQRRKLQRPSNGCALEQLRPGRHQEVRGFKVPTGVGSRRVWFPHEPVQLAREVSHWRKPTESDSVCGGPRSGWQELRYDDSLRKGRLPTGLVCSRSRDRGGQGCVRAYRREVWRVSEQRVGS
jgi:hypothetical protein